MRNVVITGCASGMGAAAAQILRRQGVNIIGIDIKDADIVADLGTAEGRATAIAEVGARVGDSLDGLATFAAIPPIQREGIGGDLVAVTYFGTTALIEGLYPLLSRGREPAVVTLGSGSVTSNARLAIDVTEACLDDDEQAARAVAEQHPDNPPGVYAAAKLAVARWTRRTAIRPEWGGAGLTLNCVCPGLIDTPMLAASRAAPGPLRARMSEPAPLPVGREGRPEEVSAVVAFLLGPQARYVCGTVIFVDGGTDAALRTDDWPAPRSLVDIGHG